LGNRKRKYKGVEQISRTSVRIKFTYLGRRWPEIEQIKTGDADVVHQSCKKWEDARARIVADIKAGRFDYAAYFPKSKQLEEVQALLSQNKNKGITVGELLMRHYYEKCRVGEDTSTDEDLRVIKRDWIPSLGDTPVKELTWLMVKDLILDRGEWAQKDNHKWTSNQTKTIKNKLSVLRAALQAALEEGTITENVLAGKSVSGIKVEFNPTIDTTATVKNSDRVPFTKKERERILKHCSEQEYAVFQFWWWTGVRSSELVCLNWNDIKNNEVRINKAFPSKSKKVKTVKTKNGNRRIPILPDADKALSIEKKFTYNKNDKYSIIFRNPNTGKPWTDKMLQDHLKVICKKADVDYKCPYTCRHTFAAMWLQAKEDIIELSKIMGHSKRSETIDMYGHWVVNENKISGGKITKMFSNIN